MPIQIRCPSCAKVLAVQEALAGKVAKCPCGQLFSVPAVKVVTPPARSIAPASLPFAEPLQPTKSAQLPAAQAKSMAWLWATIGGAAALSIATAAYFWLNRNPGAGTSVVAATQPQANPEAGTASGKQIDSKSAETGASAKPMPPKNAGGSIRGMLPLTGKPVDRGVALERFTKLLPTDDTVKWLKALSATTGRDNSTLFLQSVSAFGHKTSAMFEGGKFQPDVSAKLLSRLGSLQRDEFRKWLDAFDQVMGQQCSDVAVALLLLSADPLFEGDAYAAPRGQKHRERLKQLKQDVVDRWCKAIPAFRDDELDAALTIALRDDCFTGESFNRPAFDALLKAE